MRRWALRIVAWLAAVGVCVVPASGPAAAEVTGPCTGSVDGVDVAGRSSSDPDDAIVVERDATIDIEASAPSPIDEYEVQLSFAGFRWTVASDRSDAASWTKTVDVADYARFGVGLYRVHAVSRGTTMSCEGAVLIRVGGSPFTSIAGWVALSLAGSGVGAAAAAARARRGTAGHVALGALGGLGAVLLLQQFSITYPTRTVALIGIAAGALLPVAAARLGPSPDGAAARTTDVEEVRHVG